MIKRIKEHTKRVWSERDREEAGAIWGAIGIAALIIVGGAALVAGVGLFLPALFVMWTAGFVHPLWDQVPTLSYMESVGFMIGFWVVSWTVGVLVRIFLFALLGGGK